MKLFYQSYPDNLEQRFAEQDVVIIIPGLFGSTTNWRSFARKLGEHHPVMVIDQRNHGQSDHAASNSYADMTADLLSFIDQQQLEKVILCGHSMGGKTAMSFSLSNPERVSKLAVLDIAPVAYTHSHAPFLDALIEIDLSQLSSRSEADRLLQSAIPDIATRMFLLQSLTGTPGKYTWRLNLPVLRQEMSKIVGFPISDLEGLSYKADTVFIYGENSDYVKSEDHNLIKQLFPKTSFEGIANAGHWLHVEQANAVLAALLTFLQKKAEK